MNRLPSLTLKSLLLHLVGLAIASGSVADVPFSPSVPDEHTLHLWHLDEVDAPFADAGKFPCTLHGLLLGATANVPSAPGLGNSVSFLGTTSGPAGTRVMRGPILLAKPVTTFGPGDNVDGPFPISGADGSFTIEAVVHLDLLPGEAPGTALGIVSMDDESEGRVFNLRIEKPGILSFLRLSSAGPAGSGMATIPTTGPHGINTTDWFHVAVTYDGRAGVPGNLKLYWTRLSAGVESANLIGQDTLRGALSSSLGDFAIGNLARSAESDPFPGRIDEVRISSIARRRFDFFFVSAAAKARLKVEPIEEPPPKVQLVLRSLSVDGAPTPVLPNGVEIDAGRQRLDFDFGFPKPVTNPAIIRWRLEGAEEKWQTSGRGMALICEVLDQLGTVISEATFPALGRSPGWEEDIKGTLGSRRVEPLFLPAAARSLRISLSAGTPDTTGFLVVDNLSLAAPDSRLEKKSWWANGSFTHGDNLNANSGTPKEWQRSGTEPAIARVIMRGDNPLLGLTDTDPEKSAMWSSTQKLPPIPASGMTALLRWTEDYNVIGGALHRATYTNLPPGKYVLRAIAVVEKPDASTHLAIPITVRPPHWQRPWFLPTSVAVGVALVALGFLQLYQNRARRRLARLQAQHALERDRARIARDMHDDLGTRVTVLTMTASFIQRDIERDPMAVRRHLTKLDSTARELVTAMEGLVWTVDPSNDKLDQLASRLGSLVDEIFRDSPIRILLTVPTNLPPIALPSDFRHHFSLSVKEALHNILKHAGPCQGSLEMRVEENELITIIADRGVGFDSARALEGNGLGNLDNRLKELGGSCTIESAHGKGTSVTLRCPLKNVSKS